MLKKYLELFKTSKLVRNSAIYFVGAMVANVFGYIFHLLVGRILGPSDYSVIVSLLSIYVVIMTGLAFIQTVAAKFTSNYYADKNYSQIRALKAFLTKKFFVFSILLFIGCVALSKVISDFLHIANVWYMIILSSALLTSLLLLINKGVLQGIQKFKQLAIIAVIESGGKLLLAVSLIYIGLRLYGTIGAIALSPLIGYLLTLAYLKFLKKYPTEKSTLNRKEVLVYSVSAVFVVLILTLYYTVDVFLAKHYFSELQAGYYSALNTFGKIIFFGTSAVAGVMFPMVAAKFKKNENYRKIFWQSFAIVGIVVFFAVVVYFAFPDLIINLLLGTQYLAVRSDLGFMAIFVALYSLVFLFGQYFIAIQNYKSLYLLITGFILEIVLILIFHNTIREVIFSLIASMFCILIASMIFYIFTNRNGNKEKVAVNSNTNI